MSVTRRVPSSFAFEVLVNVVLPYVIYARAEARMGPVHALLAASLPPIVWSVIEFAWKRRVDAISMIALAGIVLLLLAFVGGGSFHVLQLREKLVTGLIGLVFLVSAAVGRPLIYSLALASKRRKSESEAQEFEQLRERAGFRRTMRVMTLVWGFGLVAEAALACVLVFRLPIKTYLVVSPVLGYGTMGALALWTFLYVKQRRRNGLPQHAAAS